MQVFLVKKLAHFPSGSVLVCNVMNVLNLNLTCTKCRIIVDVCITNELQIICIVVNNFHDTINKTSLLISLRIHSVLDRQNDKHIVRVNNICRSDSGERCNVRTFSTVRNIICGCLYINIARKNMTRFSELQNNVCHAEALNMV